MQRRKQKEFGDAPRNTEEHVAKKAKNSYSSSGSQYGDDTIGHIDARKDDVIKDRCKYP